MIREKLIKYFRPEFLNRLDELIPFHALSEKDIKDILDLELSRIVKTLKNNQGIELVVSDEVKEYLAKIGFDLDFGARPLKRAIERNLLNNLALKILDGLSSKKIKAEMQNDKIIFIK